MWSEKPRVSFKSQKKYNETFHWIIEFKFPKGPTHHLKSNEEKKQNITEFQKTVKKLSV